METSTWAIVLAAGDGTRLRSLTGDPRGRVVPKQFCSLRGGPSLLVDALRRAGRVAPPERTLVVVAESQREFWREPLAHLPRENVLVQPANHGTTAGLLLALLRVIARDAEAVVAVLPSDHHVQRESVLNAALGSSLRAAKEARDGRAIVLLGIRPDGPDSGYGWIVSEPATGRLRHIRGFVEKPDPAVAERLYRSGGLWSSFLMAARADTFLALIEQRVPDLVGAFRAHWPTGGAWTTSSLAQLYAQIGPSDLSRDVLQGAEQELLVFEVPAVALHAQRRFSSHVEWHGISPRPRLSRSVPPRPRVELERNGRCEPGFRRHCVGSDGMPPRACQTKGPRGT